MHIYTEGFQLQVLVLVETEFIFFIVAGVVLCFGFVIKTVLIIHQYSIPYDIMLSKKT